MNCLAIIPARGGSKGVVGKNIRVVGGRPLLSYSIEHARSTPEITRVVVSTDDQAIASVAREYGAEVVARPADLSGDTATSESALTHVLQHLRSSEGYVPDLVVFLQATSPIRQPDDISRAIQQLVAEGADSLFSACVVHGFVWRRERGEKEWRSFSYDFRTRQRRQDAPEDVVENGSIYVFRPEILERTGNRLGGRITAYLMDPADSFQVDVPADLELMEQLLVARRVAPGPAVLAPVRLLVLDFDGVLTDNSVIVTDDGREAVRCSRSDGWGIARLRDAGIEVVVLSTETNAVVAARCAKLRIRCIQACDDKRSRIEQLVAELGFTASEVAYVGNDVNDLASMRWVGVPIAVADARPEVKAVARLVTTRTGGNDAVREVADWILSTRAARDTVNHDSTSSASGGVT
jgi:N-acylneuraminate cytidylyltransferase